MKTKAITYLAAFIVALTLAACDSKDDPGSVIVTDVSATTIEVKKEITFTDKSIGVKSRVWIFPGGTPCTSTDAVVKVAFANVGSVTCKLIVEFDDNSTSTKNILIIVTAEGAYFDATVSATTIEKNKTITFIDSSIGVKSRIWTFPGGTPATSTDAAVGVQFSSVGPVTCKLVVVFDDDSTQTKDFAIVVTEPIYFAATVSATTTEKNTTITFTDNSTGVRSRIWTFPGGTPATSTDAVVGVQFSGEGPVTCNLTVVFNDDSTQTKDFVIQVGNELYGRGIFGFEDDTSATEAWQTWVNGDASALTFTIDHTQGANGTSSCAKIVVNTPGVEIQLFTKGNTKPFNAVLKSNKSYTFSFWIKSPTLTELFVAAVENGSPTQWHGFVWETPVSGVASGWTKKQIVFDTGNLSEGQLNNVYTQFAFKPPTAGTYYMDEVSLKEN